MKQPQKDIIVEVRACAELDQYIPISKKLMNYKILKHIQPTCW